MKYYSCEPNDCIHKTFMDFKKEYNTVSKVVLYYMIKSRTLMKRVWVIKMCKRLYGVYSTFILC
jgi:hypothetical protein